MMKGLFFLLVMVKARKLFFPGQPSGGGCDCQPIIACASDFDSITQDCTLGDGADGVCCPADGDNIGTRGQGAAAGVGNSMLGPNTRAFFSEAAPSVGQNSLDVAARAGVAAVSSLAALEQKLIHTNYFLERGTPASNHLHWFRITPEARAMDRRAWAIVSASSCMAAE
ncbi:hypothetical protein GWK47_000733 [Chionoecetes opilio]|uniref:Uncharacterized protein n=1 Tax=Chionoecetes opilio TaxID=41210 RepID=A0A8J5CTL6_CHIOP|nr:hypothetical protein GWK47_000733 [Chionoecetes opilio]